MRNASANHRKVFSRRAAARLERVCAFLRLRHPAKTADFVEADTGVQAWTVRKWLEGKAHPSGAAVVMLAAAYGPDFLCAIMDNPPDWMIEARRAQARADLAGQIAELEARAAAHEAGRP